MSDIVLRAPRSGELSWLQYRHMVTVAPMYGWDDRYEAHLAEIMARVLSRDPVREHFWVAEREGKLLGCVGIARETEQRARLRLMFVEPEARGLGLGRRLADTAVAFARDAGYAEVVLWTVDVLEVARAIYAAIGFKKIAEQPSDLSASMRDETWLLKL